MSSTPTAPADSSEAGATAAAEAALRFDLLLDDDDDADDAAAALLDAFLELLELAAWSLVSSAPNTFRWWLAQYPREKAAFSQPSTEQARPDEDALPLRGGMDADVCGSNGSKDRERSHLVRSHTAQWGQFACPSFSCYHRTAQRMPLAARSFVCTRTPLRHRVSGIKV